MPNITSQGKNLGTIYVNEGVATLSIEDMAETTNIDMNSPAGLEIRDTIQKYLVSKEVHTLHFLITPNASKKGSPTHPQTMANPNLVGLVVASIPGNISTLNLEKNTLIFDISSDLRAIQAVMKGLAAKPTVRTLNLSENTLNPFHFDALKAGLPKTYIANLDVSNNFIKPEELQGIKNKLGKPVNVTCNDNAEYKERKTPSPRALSQMVPRIPSSDKLSLEPQSTTKLEKMREQKAVLKTGIV